MSSSWAAAAASAGASVIEEFHTYWDGVDPQVEMVPGPKRWNSDNPPPIPQLYLDDVHTFQGAIHVGAKNFDDYQKIARKFVDELYGTEVTISPSGDEDDVVIGDAGAIATGEDRDHWGLDIRRIMKDTEGEDITKDHPLYYETLTRGEVDWEFYQNGTEEDNMYIAAHKKLGKELDDKEGITSLEEIRQVNPMVYEDAMHQARHGEMPDWMRDWNGKYEPKFDPDDPPKYEAAELDVSYDRAPMKHWISDEIGDMIMQEPAVLKNIPKVNVERPSNLSASAWSI